MGGQELTLSTYEVKCGMQAFSLANQHLAWGNLGDFWGTIFINPEGDKHIFVKEDVDGWNPDEDFLQAKGLEVRLGESEINPCAFMTLQNQRPYATESSVDSDANVHSEQLFLEIASILRKGGHTFKVGLVKGTEVIGQYIAFSEKAPNLSHYGLVQTVPVIKEG